MIHDQNMHALIAVGIKEICKLRCDDEGFHSPEIFGLGTLKVFEFSKVV